MHCSWHRSQNLKKKFFYLNKKSDNIYEKIVNLPYEKNRAKFEITYEEIISHQLVNESEIQYLKNYYNEKGKWSLAYVKNHFTCGIFTTQRAESINNMMKCVLNKKSSITEVINFVNKREFEIHPRAIEELGTILYKTESKLFNKVI